MPPRRKPTSTNQKKAQQKLNRAIKRGDVEKPTPATQSSRKRPHRGPKAHLANSTNQQAIAKVKYLQSAFLKPSKEYLEITKELASSEPLIRPIPNDSIISDEDRLCLPRNNPVSPLTCPKRPKWRYEMTKTEVEKNEEGLHTQWLQTTDSYLGAISCETNVPQSPTYFERNVQVWRQLWRVVEISAVLCILIDVRCPLLHLPPSLISFLQSFCPSGLDIPGDKPKPAKYNTKSVVLVLTKTDITEPFLVTAWLSYLNKQFPAWRIVPLHAYRRKEEGWAQQGSNRPRYIPNLEQDDRAALIEVLKSAHADLLRKPEGASEKWVPPKLVPTTALDWEAAATISSMDARHGDSDHEAEHDDEVSDKDGQNTEAKYLTIGLIGQPNVGKSSLLNALFGKIKVKASKTPGKTKHFQTMFLTSEIRIADCPGLVFPSYARMEAQVLSGILPISRINAILGCMSWIANLAPLEKILSLDHPNKAQDPTDTKRTWRDGGPIQPSEPERTWTTVDILTAFAMRKGWMTAKAGREDIMRAGNAILRSLAEGKIKWAFSPPDFQVPEAVFGLGIGLAHQDFLSYDGEHEDHLSESEDEVISGDSDSEDTTDDGSVGSENEEVAQPSSSRFAALALTEDMEDSE